MEENTYKSIIENKISHEYDLINNSKVGLSGGLTKFKDWLKLDLGPI